MKKSLVFLLVLFVLPVCAPSAADIQKALEQTQAAYTVTPAPPTSTPEPTATITQTPTPVFAIFTTEQALAAFTAAGLEVVDPRPMTKDDYGMAPMTALNGVIFTVPSICSDCHARLFSCNSQSDLDALKSYYDEMGKASALFFSWTFAKDNLLLQINGDATEELARKYESVLNSLGQ